MAIKLTKKQQLFVEEYLVDLNATQAAIRAGYSKKTSTSIGHENLTKPDIASAISKASGKRIARTRVTADMVINELAKLAFFDVRGLYDDNGDVLPIHKLPDDVAAAIGGVDVSYKRDQDGNVSDTETAKLKIIDKKGSLELLGRHLKLFTDKIEMEVTDTIAERLIKARGIIK